MTVTQVGVPNAIFISIVAALLVLTFASFVSFIKSFHPLEVTGTDDDEIVEKTDVLKHMVDCGLLYPALYIYAWLGIYLAVTSK